MGHHTQKSDDLVIRAPAPEEWGRVLGEAFATTRSEEPPPLSAHSHVVAAEADGEVVGCIAAERVYCVSLFHVRRDWRGTHLAGAMARIIQRRNTEGLREMFVTTNPHVERLAYGMGFVPVEGTLWRRGG